MYCYSRVLVDRKMFGNLEHAIEKKNSDKLIECIPNIGLHVASAISHLKENPRIPESCQNPY